MTTPLLQVLRTEAGWKLALTLVKGGNEVPDKYLFRYRMPVLYSEWEAGIMLFTLVQINGAVGAIPWDNPVANALRGFLDSVTDLLFESMLRFSKLPVDVAAKDEATLARMDSEGKGSKAGDVGKKSLGEFKSILEKNNIKMVIVNGSKCVSESATYCLVSCFAFYHVYAMCASCSHHRRCRFKLLGTLHTVLVRPKQMRSRQQGNLICAVVWTSTL